MFEPPVQRLVENLPGPVFGQAADYVIFAVPDGLGNNVSGLDQLQGFVPPIARCGQAGRSGT